MRFRAHTTGRWGWASGLTAAASLTLAACGTPASTTTSTGDNDAAASLADAVAATLAEPTGRSVVQIDLDLAAPGEVETIGAPVELRTDSRYDTGTGRAALSQFIRFPTLATPPPTPDIAMGPATAAYLESLNGLLSPDGTATRAVVDLPARLIYSEAAGMVPDWPSVWMSAPMDEWGSNVIEPRGLDDLDGGRAFVAYLNAAADVESSADGDRTRYDGVVRTAELPDPEPISYSEGERWTTPDVPFTAWVDAAGYLTRVELTMDGVDSQLVPWDTSATIDGQPPRTVGTVQISVELSELGQPVAIELPPADQVTSLDAWAADPSAGLPPDVRAELCAGWDPSAIGKAPPADPPDGGPDTLPLDDANPHSFAAMCGDLAATPG